MSESDLKKKKWWSYLEEGIQELLLESQMLLSDARKWDGRFHDYSFVVFPAAKAYEGFLKKLFLDLGFISKEEYSGKRFRIGKALNPSLEKGYREKEGVYDKTVDFCGGRKLADRLWLTWKNCRNLLFHWFPDEKNAITLEEAKERVGEIIATIDMAVEECEVKKI